MIWKRAIAHMDMNAFFASIEQFDYPALRGKPVAVTNGLRGSCVITCSYEARAVGVKTTMRLKEARKLCPNLVQRPTRPERYAQISTNIMTALELDISPRIEICSVDECFLDVTDIQRLFSSHEVIGQRIKQTVYSASGLKCSVGISGGKLLAKWAAKQQKPDGLTILPPDQARAALADRPVDDVCGIGEGIARHLAQYGAYTCGDVARLPIAVLAGRWGVGGRRLWSVCRGYDPDSLVFEVAAPKSFGHGKVMPPDTRDSELIKIYLFHMAEKLAARLRKYEYEATTFLIGVVTVYGFLGQKYKSMLTSDGRKIRRMCVHFLRVHWNGLGVFQVQINALDPKPTGLQYDWLRPELKKRRALNEAVDKINSRFGEFAVAPSRLLNRSDMPNVISPAWKPTGHRATIQGRATRKRQPIPMIGFIS